MKEARIILPHNGALTPDVIAAEEAIFTCFGGSTISSASGNWRHPNGSIVREIVRVVDIAYDPNNENDRKLFDLAQRYREVSGEVSMYIRYSNGHVQITSAKSGV